MLLQNTRNYTPSCYAAYDVNADKPLSQCFAHASCTWTSEGFMFVG